jgi:hypothetical protein
MARFAKFVADRDKVVDGAGGEAVRVELIYVTRLVGVAREKKGNL